MRIVEDQGDGFYYAPQVEVYIEEVENYDQAKNAKCKEAYTAFLRAWKNVFSQCKIVDLDMLAPEELEEKVRDIFWLEWNHFWEIDVDQYCKTLNEQFQILSERWDRYVKKHYPDWGKYLIKMIVEPNEWIEFNPTTPKE